MFCTECFIQDGKGTEVGPYIYNGKSLCYQHFWDETKRLPEPTKELAVVEDKPKRTRGTRLPEGWIPPTDAVQRMVEELGVTQEALVMEHRRFCDYYYSAPGQKGVKTLWDRAWCNWMRNAADRGNLRGHRSAPRRANDEKIQSLMEMDIATGE